MKLQRIYPLLGILVFLLSSCGSDFTDSNDLLESRAFDRKKRRKRATIAKVNPGFQGGDCVDCLNPKDTLNLQFFNLFVDTDGVSCTLREIELETIRLINQAGDECVMPLTAVDIQVQLGPVTFKTPPFDLPFTRRALVNVPFHCSSIDFDGQEGFVVIDYVHIDCDEEPIAVSDTLVYEIGCPNFIGDEVIYSNHITPTQNDAPPLPYYTLGETSVTLQTNVQIKDGGRAYLRVCDENKGFIKVSKNSNSSKVGVKVEKGSYFKAVGSKIQ